jgi:hypothetical protein
MERAQALERICAGTAELNIVADHVLDLHALTNGRDVAIRDTAGHRFSLERAPTAPIGLR